MPDLEPKIKALILTFPHGTSVYEAQKIAQLAEKIIGAGVSEGGMDADIKVRSLCR